MEQEQQAGVERSRSNEDAGISALFDFSFKRFVTLSVIKVLYILGLVLIVLSWLIGTIGGLTQGIAQGFVALILGTLMAVISLIFFRIWLEIIVVVFRIGENVSNIASRN